MIRLVFKSLKAFFVEKKVLIVLLILSLCIGNLIYFYSTIRFLEDKESLSNHIDFSITGLSQIDEFEKILMNKEYLQYLDITTDAVISPEPIIIGGKTHTISCSLSDPNLDKVEFISDSVSKDGVDNFIIYSHPGANSSFYYSKCGDFIYIYGEAFLHVADGFINFPTYLDGSINKSAFFDMFGKEEERSFNVYAYYTVDIPERQFDMMVKELNDMGIEAKVSKYDKMTFGDVLMTYRDSMVLVSFIISMVMYGHYVDSRLRDYSVIRMAGIGSTKLKLMYIMESMSIFTISYILMAIVWLVLIRFVFDVGTYNYGKICLFGYLILLVAYVIVNVPYLKRIDSKSTIELYRKSRRIG